MQGESYDLIAAAAQHGTALNRYSDYNSLCKSESFTFFTTLCNYPELKAQTINHLMYELGKHCANSGFSFSIAAHLFAGCFPLFKYGTASVNDTVKKRIQSGAVIANAMTESESGSDSFGMKTTAEKCGNKYLLNGSKSFVTNGPVADYLIVYALTQPEKGFFGGISCFLLERGRHAFTSGDSVSKSALQSSPMCEIYFNDTEVEEEFLIAKEGAGAMIFLDSMNQERAGIAALHSGTMSRISKAVAEYVTKRVRGDKPLSAFQAVQFHIAEIALRAETSRLMAIRAAKAIDDGDGTLEAAQAKIHVSQSYADVARIATELLGGYGIMNDSILGTIISDAQASLIYSGPNDVLRNLIASKL